MTVTVAVPVSVLLPVPAATVSLGRGRSRGRGEGGLAAAASLRACQWGANVYEVNTWLWSFGRGMPRLGGLSIEQTEASRLLRAKPGASVQPTRAEPKRIRTTAPE